MPKEFRTLDTLLPQKTTARHPFFTTMSAIFFGIFCVDLRIDGLMDERFSR